MCQEVAIGQLVGEIEKVAGGQVVLARLEVLEAAARGQAVAQRHEEVIAIVVLRPEQPAGLLDQGA